MVRVALLSDDSTCTSMVLYSDYRALVRALGTSTRTRRGYSKDYSTRQYRYSYLPCSPLSINMSVRVLFSYRKIRYEYSY